MVRNIGKLHAVGERKETGTKIDMSGKLEDDVEALFRLPLAEFTDARNTLAARLKKSGRGCLNLSSSSSLKNADRMYAASLDLCAKWLKADTANRMFLRPARWA